MVATLSDARRDGRRKINARLGHSETRVEKNHAIRGHRLS
jgi:hypothetical protein